MSLFTNQVDRSNRSGIFLNVVLLLLGGLFISMCNDASAESTRNEDLTPYESVTETMAENSVSPYVGGEINLDLRPENEDANKDTLDFDGADNNNSPIKITETKPQEIDTSDLLRHYETGEKDETYAEQDENHKLTEAEKNWLKGWHEFMIALENHVPPPQPEKKPIISRWFNIRPLKGIKMEADLGRALGLLVVVLLVLIIIFMLMIFIWYRWLRREAMERKQIRETLYKFEERFENFTKIEEDFKHRRAKLFSIIDSIPDLIYYKNRKGVYLGCNDAFSELVGRTPQKILGKTDYDLFSKEVADAFRENDLKMLSKMKPRTNQEWVSYPDGKKILMETLKSPFFDEHGKPIGLVGVSREITGREKESA